MIRPYERPLDLIGFVTNEVLDLFLAALLFLPKYAARKLVARRASQDVSRRKRGPLSVSSAAELIVFLFFFSPPGPGHLARPQATPSLEIRRIAGRLDRALAGRHERDLGALFSAGPRPVAAGADPIAARPVQAAPCWAAGARRSDRSLCRNATALRRIAIEPRAAPAATAGRFDRPVSTSPHHQGIADPSSACTRGAGSFRSAAPRARGCARRPTSSVLNLSLPRRSLYAHPNTSRCRVPMLRGVKYNICSSRLSCRS